MERLGADISERLGWYVYRLIDPRNGETFYVGKGKGERVLHHVKHMQNLEMDEASVDLKKDRIKQIQALGLEVGLIIHRHGLDERTAYIVEAALIDAYPGLHNRVSGHYSDEFGCQHLREIVSAYQRPEFVADEPLILISIGRSFDASDTDLYDAVRGMWKVRLDKVKQYKLVLAHRQGIVVGAYRPSRWLQATKKNFKRLKADEEGRFGFEGVEAEREIWARYHNKRVPQELRRRGAANPIRYIDPMRPLTAAV